MKNENMLPYSILSKLPDKYKSIKFIPLKEGKWYGLLNKDISVTVLEETDIVGIKSVRWEEHILSHTGSWGGGVLIDGIKAFLHRRKV